MQTNKPSVIKVITRKRSEPLADTFKATVKLSNGEGIHLSRVYRFKDETRLGATLRHLKISDSKNETLSRNVNGSISYTGK